MKLHGPSVFLSAICMTAVGAVAQTPDLYDPDAYRAIYLEFSQPDYWEQLEDNYDTGVEIEADMTVDGVTYSDVGVRFRGNTSYRNLPEGSEKKSFNIRLDSFVDGQDIYGYDHLNLNNGFHDPTFIREFLTYMISREYGIAPGANFVTLYLNGEYWGVYINVQQPNKDMMEQWFRSNDGQRYRGFPTIGSFRNGRCALTYLGSDVQEYLDAYQAKEGDGTDLMELCDVLNNTPDGQLQATLPSYFNLDQFYYHAAIMSIVTQTDSYIGSGKDHYLYHDETHGDFYMFPFDVNEALAGDERLLPWNNRDSPNHPALSQTWQFDDWEERYNAHFLNVMQNTFSWDGLEPIITQYHGMIADDVVADTKKVYTTEQFFDNITQMVEIPGHRGPVDVPGLRPLIEGRESYVMGLPEFKVPRVTLTGLDHSPEEPGANDEVCVTVQASSNASDVWLYARNVGAFQAVPMADDGRSCDGDADDGIYGAMIPAAPAGTLIDYYVEAHTGGGAATYFPATASLGAVQYDVNWPQGTSPIVINEFVAKNVEGIVDENDQHEDWLELYNNSSQVVDLGGMYLTDDLAEATQWEIPSGTTIAPGGTVLIWCDEDGDEGPLHANFKLSSQGEDIALFDTDGQTQLARVTFGIQVDDVATGRLFDASDDWVSIFDPTPDASNDTGCGVRAYDQLDPTYRTMDVELEGNAEIGSALTLRVTGAPANSEIYVTWGTGFAYSELATGGVLLNNMDRPTRSFTSNGNGELTKPIGIPDNPGLVGQFFYIQVAAPEGSPNTYHFSNGTEIRVCP